MLRVLVTDSTFEELDIERAILEPLGCIVESHQCRTPAQLLECVPDADFVITQFAPVNSAVIDAMARARLIVRYGIGVDNVDLDSARAHAIPVCNVPDYCIDEVADHTLALILAATRRVVPHWLHLSEGRWGLSGQIEGMKVLCELSVGVVGCGQIGRAVVQRLHAFGCRILVHDPGVGAERVEALGASPVGSLAEVLRESDVVTLHCPSTAQTRRMINADTLSMLKPGSILVNLSRGDLVDTEALVEALSHERLASAALDVFDPEPLPAEHPLRNLPNVILSPHIASASPNAVLRLRGTVAGTVASVIRGEPPSNVVNGIAGARAVAGNAT
jgi:D-3-phosphoglycerate dehydrogenase